jgi:hypothetical protein
VPKPVIKTKSTELNHPTTTQTAVNITIPPPSPVPPMEVQQDKQEKVDSKDQAAMPVTTVAHPL